MTVDRYANLCHCTKRHIKHQVKQLNYMGPSHPTLQTTLCTSKDINVSATVTPNDKPQRVGDGRQ